MNWRVDCYEAKNWRVAVTLDRLISNIPAACKVLKEQGYVNLAGQLGRDCENLEYWQAHGGLKEVGEENIPDEGPAG